MSDSFATPWTVGSFVCGISQARILKQMANKNMKRARHLSLEKCKSNHNEISLTPVRMAIIKKSTNNKFWRGGGEKGMLLHYWWECKLIQLLWKMVWRFLKKLRIKPQYDPAIPLLSIYPEETKTRKDTCSSHCSLQHYLQ